MVEDNGPAFRDLSRGRLIFYMMEIGLGNGEDKDERSGWDWIWASNQLTSLGGNCSKDT